MTASWALLHYSKIWFDGKITSLRFPHIKGYQGWRGEGLPGTGPSLDLKNLWVCNCWVKIAMTLTCVPGPLSPLQPRKQCQCNLVSRVPPEKQGPDKQTTPTKPCCFSNRQMTSFSYELGRSGWDVGSTKWWEAYTGTENIKMEQSPLREGTECFPLLNGCIARSTRDVYCIHSPQINNIGTHTDA